jgi:esterase
MMTALNDHIIELSHLTFHYREAGDPDTPPLVLLHALGSDAKSWDEIALFLADRFHVFALDQRGHGKSARPGIYSFELMRDDLKAFADTLSLDRFTLIGHSMGGTVAFLFTERWPDRIERLIIEDTPPPYPGAIDPNSPEPPEEEPSPMPFDWQVVPAIFRQLRSPDTSWWNNLSTITAPTLLISGGSTSHISQEKLAEVAGLIPDCRFVTIDGAGHFVHEKCPKEYKDNLRDFLFE